MRNEAVKSDWEVLVSKRVMGSHNEDIDVLLFLNCPEPREQKRWDSPA